MFCYEQLKIIIDAHPRKIEKRHIGNFEVYRAEAKTSELVSHLEISIANSLTGDFFTDSLLFDLTKQTPSPIPFISYRHTNPKHIKNRISIFLTIQTNEYFENKFKIPLYSDIIFLDQEKYKNKEEKCYPGKIIWQILTNEGFAKHIPYVDRVGQLKDRWMMIPKTEYRYENSW
jgi:hypothetical protein